MSLLINSYEMRPPAVTLGGLAGLWLGGAGAMTDTEFSGAAALRFGQSAALKAGKAMAGLAQMRLQQVAALIPGVVPLLGTAGLALNASAFLRAALALEASTGLVMGRTGTLRKGGQLAGVTDLVLAQGAALRARQKLTGESILTLGQTGRLQANKKLSGTGAMTLGQSAALQVAVVTEFSIQLISGAIYSGQYKFGGSASFYGNPPPVDVEVRTSPPGFKMFEWYDGWQDFRWETLDARNYPAGYYDLTYGMSVVGPRYGFGGGTPQGFVQVLDFSPANLFSDPPPDGHAPLAWEYQ